MLLLLLTPLLALAVWHAAQYDTQETLGMAFSAYGRELLVFRCIPGDGGPPYENTFVVQAWDLASRRLVRSEVSGGGRLAASMDGDRLIEHAYDGLIRLLDSRSLEPLQESRMPEGSDRVRGVLAANRLLVVNSTNDDNISVAICIDLQNRRVVYQSSGEYAWAEMSRDGRRLFVSQYESKTKTWRTDVFDVEGASLAMRPDLSFPGQVKVAAPDGSRVFALVGPSPVLRHLATKQDHVWKAPSAWAGPGAVFFTADGQYFCSIHDDGMLGTFDAATGALVAEQQLSRLSEPLLEYAVSPDGRWLAGTTDRWQVRLWDLTNGKLAARFPDHRLLRYGLTAAFLAWCLGWVVTGLRIARLRPWFDVLLISGVTIAVLIVHAATRPRWAIHPAFIASSLALLTALMGLLILWWIHGGLRWSLRLAGLVAGSAAIAAVLLASGHRDDAGVWNIMLGAVTFVGGLALLLRLWRWRRWTIACYNKTTLPAAPCDRWQLPLRDMLMVTAAIALLLAVLRFVMPDVRDVLVLTYVSLHGAALAVTVFVATWAALSRWRLWVRLAVLCLMAAVNGAIPNAVSSIPGPDPLWWCETLHGVTAAAVWLFVGIYRLHGYRLIAVDPC